MPRAKPPSWIDKVNFIVDYVANPCHTPFYVLIETAGPAAGHFVLNLLLFDLGDIVRGFVRPKGLRSGRHGRKRKAKKGGFELPELGELIGENIANAEEMKARQVTRGVKTLWIIDGLTQRLFFYYMLLDLTTDFLYEWASAIVEADASTCSARGRSHQRTEGGPVLPSFGYNTYFLQTIIYRDGDVTIGPGAVDVGEGTWSIIFSCDTVQDGNEHPFTNDVWWTMSVNGKHVDTQLVSLDYLDTESILLSASIIGPARIIIYVYAHQYATNVKNADLMIIGRT